jgi:Ca2+-binding RTX toxin-like protein
MFKVVLPVRASRSHECRRTGNDISVGKRAADTFVFASNFGRDVLKDVVAGASQDSIQYSKTVFDSFANVLAHASRAGNDAAIATGRDPPRTEG